MAKATKTTTRRSTKSWLDEFRSVQFLAGKDWLTQTLGLTEEQVEVLRAFDAAYFTSGDIGVQCLRLHQIKFPLQEGNDLVDITLKLVARLIERGVTPNVFPPPITLPAPPEIRPPSLHQLRRLNWDQLKEITIAITGQHELPRGIVKDDVGIWLYHKANKEFGNDAGRIMAEAYSMLGFNHLRV